MTTLSAVPDVEIETPARPARTGDWVLVAACSLVVLAALAPELVLRDAMPLGSDLTGHAVVSWFDRTQPLGFLPGSWSDAAFNGFPVNGLYPWLPSWLVGMASFLLPLSVALKLGVVVPLVALPWAAWRAGTWADLARPVPVMLAAATLPFLFDTSCGSCGGTISSTVNGELAFAWAMLLGVLALGAVDRLARTGRGVVTAALLVAGTAFSHPLPTLWLVVGLAVVCIGREVWADRAVAARVGVSALVAVLLAAMWWLPFLAYRDWAPGNPLVRDGSTLSWLLPGPIAWELLVTALAVVGAVVAVRRRAWLLVALGVGALVAVAAFLRFTDGGPFYSIRLLPFWQLGRWTLAAVGFSVVVALVVARVRTDRERAVDPRLAPVVWIVLAVVGIGSTWGWWGVTTPATSTADGRASVLGVEVPVTTVSAGVRATFGGAVTTAATAELEAVQGLLRDVGAKVGCGTLMWDDGDPAAEGGAPLGDVQALWQSPIWTDGCIRAADGVLVDSSLTAPGMAMTKSLVSETVEPLLPGRPQYAFDLATGVTRMQAMGVGYYLTHGGRAASEAATTEGLSAVAQAGPWQVWKVDKGVRVVSLTSLPAVFEPAVGDAEWEGLSNRYFTAPTFTSVPLAQSGPATWPRGSTSALPETVATPFAGVSGIVDEGDRITFQVARVGTPVVVRASAFPGWTVEGAEGPYRVTANYLAVVPTSTTVTLTKGRTTVDWVAIAAGVLGLGLAVALAVHGALERRDARREQDDLDDAAAYADDELDALADRTD